MGRVRILPEEVVSRIAAGEVIERPASVVKELVENSLDAQASSLSVTVSRAGKSLVRVKDDGIGIETDDLEKIFLRHATSKISRVADLNTITSLGFRGEALYSIAAVSDIILRSRARQAGLGSELHVRAGEKVAQRSLSMPPGTEIEVRELFFNTPARRKFLKSEETEFRQVLATFLPYTLVFPSLRFTLIHNDRVFLTLNPEENLMDRVASALNVPKRYLLEAEFDFPDENLHLKLLLGDINLRRVRRDLQFVFINNRPVYSRSINGLLNENYRKILPPELQGVFLVFILLPPEEVDVNVHPTKREVKLVRESLILSRLQAAVEKILLRQGKMKQASGRISADNFSGKVAEPTSGKKQAGLSEPAELPLAEKGTFLAERTEGDYSGSLREKLTGARYVGSFAAKYLLFESSRSLIVIDQHAAHERIVYEQLFRQLQEGRVQVQHLLTPLVLELSPEEKLVWAEGQKELERLGFSTTLFDSRSVALHSYPVLLQYPDISLRNLLSGGKLKHCDVETLARRACRQAVMAGEGLKAEEAISLKDELLKCEQPFACPHGRPVAVEIKETFMDQQFLRK